MLYERLTWEKMRELETEVRARTPGLGAAGRTTALGAPLARLAGRLLSRFGASLEDWGDTPAGSRDCCEACG